MRKILAERRLLGGNGHIKGGYKCVCFSEAPLAVLTDKFYQRYSPFGIMVSKEWLFARGGRPVIYQTEQEFGDLPESHRWRHVLYELRQGFSYSDFAWEREWRVKCEYLDFDPSSVQVVVLNSFWANQLTADHDSDERFKVYGYSQFMDEASAEMYREPFPWIVRTIQASA